MLFEFLYFWKKVLPLMELNEHFLGVNKYTYHNIELFLESHFSTFFGEFNEKKCFNDDDDEDDLVSFNQLFFS